MDNLYQPPATTLADLPPEIWHGLVKFLDLKSIKAVTRIDVGIGAVASSHLARADPRYVWRHEWIDTDDEIETLHRLLMTRRAVRIVIPIVIYEDTDGKYTDPNYDAMAFKFNATTANHIKYSVSEIELVFKVMQYTKVDLYADVPVPLGKFIETAFLKRVAWVFDCHQVRVLGAYTPYDAHYLSFGRYIQLALLQVALNYIKRLPGLRELASDPSEFMSSILKEDELVILNRFDRKERLQITHDDDYRYLYTFHVMPDLLSTPAWIQWKYKKMQINSDTNWQSTNEMLKGRLHVNRIAIQIAWKDLAPNEKFESPEATITTMTEMFNIIRTILVDPSVLHTLRVGPQFVNFGRNFRFEDAFVAKTRSTIKKMAMEMFPGLRDFIVDMNQLMDI